MSKAAVREDRTFPSREMHEVAARSTRSWYARPGVLLSGIVIVAAALRLWKLGSVPPGLFIDEAWSTYSPKIFFGSLNPLRLPLYVTMNELATGQMFTYVFAGHSIFWTRFTTALLGIGTIPLMYALVKHWFGNRLAVLSALGVALSPWAVHFSRYAIPAMATAFWLLLMLLSLEKVLANRTRGWVAMLGFSTIGTLSTHTIMKIFLPLFLIGFIWVRRHEVKIAIAEVGRPLAIATVAVLAYSEYQILLLFRGGGGFAIQSARVHALAFIGDGISFRSAIGVVGRYLEHWNPIFLFLKGDPSPLYTTGFAGVLGILGIFVYVGIFQMWKHRRHRVASTLFFIALLWPLPSALFIPDNPNSARGTFGLAICVVLGIIGLQTVIRWCAARIKRSISPQALAQMAATIIVIGGAVTASFYFIQWPAKPGVAATFDDGYRQAADALQELPRRPVVIADVWRAQDLLAFFGYQGPRVTSLTPGERPGPDVFADSSPAYFVTDTFDDMALLQGFGYEVNVLDDIKSSEDEDLLWLAKVTHPPLVHQDVASLALDRPTESYPPVDWNPTTANLRVRSEKLFKRKDAIGYATSPAPLFNRMRVVATVNHVPDRGKLMIGFSSYADPALGSPDKVSPFIGTFIRLNVRNGRYEASAVDRSIDDRNFDFELDGGHMPVKVRVTYMYRDGLKSTFDLFRHGRWEESVPLENYVKPPLYAFFGLLSKHPSHASVHVGGFVAKTALKH